MDTVFEMGDEGISEEVKVKGCTSFTNNRLMLTQGSFH